MPSCVGVLEVRSNTLGVLFMIFTPVPYVDVTSSWVAPAGNGSWSDWAE